MANPSFQKFVAKQEDIEQSLYGQIKSCESERRKQEQTVEGIRQELSAIKKENSKLIQVISLLQCYHCNEINITALLCYCCTASHNRGGSSPQKSSHLILLDEIPMKCSSRLSVLRLSMQTV